MKRPVHGKLRRQMRHFMHSLVRAFKRHVVRPIVRVLVLAGCAALAAGLGIAILALPEPAVRLSASVAAELANSGVTHPVTAVLLNFRGYDTLLEIAVLLLALLGIATAAGGDMTAARRLHGSPQPFLQSLARLLAPLMVITAGYLLWAGSHRPGGAFQAGAVLAAGVVLLYLAGLLPERARSPWLLRLGLLAGFFVFLAVAAAPLISGAQLLQYPPEMAGALILLVESGLTLSLGLILPCLFLWLPDEHEEDEE